MNHTSKTQTFAVLGAVMALALMPILGDSAYAESTDELLLKIQKLQDKITSIQERDDVLDFAEKKLISKYHKKVMDYQTLIEKTQQKQQTQKLMKSELQKVQAEEQFQKIIREVYVANDKDRGYDSDNIAELALEKIGESENINLVPIAMDRLIKKQHDQEAKQILIQYKQEIIESIKQLEEVNNDPQTVYALTSDGVITDVTNSEINQIVTPSILTSVIKQKIQDTITESQSISEQATSEIQAKYQEAYDWAEQEEQSDSNVTSEGSSGGDDGGNGNNGNGNGGNGNNGNGNGGNGNNGNGGNGNNGNGGNGNNGNGN